MESNYTKVQRAARKLNQEAGVNSKCFTGRGKKRQFIPCARSIAMINACRLKLKLFEIVAEGYTNPCICHPNYTQEDLYNLLFD